MNYIALAKAVSPFVLTALLAIGFFYHQAQVEKLTAEKRAAYIEIANLQEKVEVMDRINKAQAAAVTRLQEKERKHETDQQRIRGQIQASPAGDDAPAAPVLVRTLDSLRQHQGQ